MSIADRKKVAERNVIRAEARLPRLDRDRELEKLRAAKRKRIFEAVFALEQGRFSHAWRSKKSWSAGLGEWTRARSAVREELRLGQHLDVILREWGYKVVDDCWIAHGHRTYVHNYDRQESVVDLERALSEYGWSWNKDKTGFGCFSNIHTGELITIEPAGSDSTSQFIHHHKSGGGE
jgi:hypothetical protein